VTVADPYADAGSITLVADAASADGELDVGETWTYTATHLVTQAEVDSNGGGDGNLENTATADSDQTGPDTDDASVPVAREPSMTFDKKVASIKNADGSNDSDGLVDTAGDVINYEFVLKNTGNVALTNVQVTDQFEDDPLQLLSNASVFGDNGNGILDVGETWTYKLSHTVTQADLAAAQQIVTTVEQIGFFTCYTEKCTGDLDLDNYAIATANYGSQVLTDSDFETVGVYCPCPDDGVHNTYGDSTAEKYWAA
jgi:hypothetical protein